ncbi:MAG: hypothetical protein ACNS62_12245 [Candidatus Cyclobacteriaceae bacterium M3_2C_046]
MPIYWRKLCTCSYFETTNGKLTEWEYKGNLFTYPKYKNRNFEVPEIRPIGDQWISVDRCYYFIGNLDLENLSFTPQQEGIVDYSGHYYAQETIQDDKGDLYLMAWMPGWDRDWLPTYMNELMKTLRTDHIQISPRSLPVDGPMTGYVVLDQVRGDQLKMQLTLELDAASFCGLNVLSDAEGEGGLFITWSGNMLNVDGVKVPPFSCRLPAVANLAILQKTFLFHAITYHHYTIKLPDFYLAKIRWSYPYC